MTFSQFEKELELKGWEIAESYGSIYLLENEYEEEKIAQAYLSFNIDDSLFFLYTDQRKTEEIEAAVDPIFDDSSAIHYLYISPRILKDLCETVAEEWESAKVTEFIAKRVSGTEMVAQKRPSTRRTINYYGEDGLRTLREMESEYGVLPHIMQIEIPTELRFRVNREGIFKLQIGSFETLLKYMNVCISQCLAVKEEYDGIDYSVLEVGDNEQYKVPQSKPASIMLHSDLDYSKLRHLRTSLTNSKYAFIDGYLSENPPYISGKVYDGEENIFFNIRASGSEIKFFPRKHKNISAFFNFFEFIQANIDDRAEPASDAQNQELWSEA